MFAVEQSLCRLFSLWTIAGDTPEKRSDFVIFRPTKYRYIVFVVESARPLAKGRALNNIKPHTPINRNFLATVARMLLKLAVFVYVQFGLFFVERLLLAWLLARRIAVDGDKRANRDVAITGIIAKSCRSDPNPAIV